jgi:2-polyprenyl-3-methyl-5-hydroxy-6-metoxy-1,4-benzoquinol methylase
MAWLCPTCREPIDAASLACAGGHQFHRADGVLVLLDDAFAQRLRPFLTTFQAARAADHKRLLDTSAYEALPSGPATTGQHEWRLRRYDLAIVNHLISRQRAVGSRQKGRLGGHGRLGATTLHPSQATVSSPLPTACCPLPTPPRVLDIGAWNGWLSHRLAARGHDVTAIDYFADAYDGLGAQRWYSTTWRAIQMDLADLAPLNQCYDVVIVNRCVQFFTDPAAAVAAAQRQVAPGGLLLLTGLQVFHDPRVKADAVARLRQTYAARYGHDLFLRPTRGYLDRTDTTRLHERGITMRPYPQLWLANLRARLDPTRPRHAYGVWHRLGPVPG